MVSIRGGCDARRAARSARRATMWRSMARLIAASMDSSMVMVALPSLEQQLVVGVRAIRRGRSRSRRRLAPALRFLAGRGRDLPDTVFQHGSEAPQLGPLHGLFHLEARAVSSVHPLHLRPRLAFVALVVDDDL